jgi:hypothetical protein
VLLVVQCHALAGNLLDPLGCCIIPHGERKICGAVPGTVVMANSPSQVLQSHPYFRNLLDVAGPLPR